MNRGFLAAVGGILLSGAFAALLMITNARRAEGPPALENPISNTDLM